MTLGDKILKDAGIEFPITEEQVEIEEKRQADFLAALSPNEREQYLRELNAICEASRVQLMKWFEERRSKSFAA